MDAKEIRLVRRGVPRWEYIEYFSTLGMEEEPGRFIGPDWEVIVGEEKQITIITCCLAEVELVFRAEEEKAGKMVDAFRKKFMRAGA